MTALITCSKCILLLLLLLYCLCLLYIILPYTGCINSVRVESYTSHYNIIPEYNHPQIYCDLNYIKYCALYEYSTNILFDPCNYYTYSLFCDFHDRKTSLYLTTNTSKQNCGTNTAG